MGEWKQRRLSDIVDLIGGGTPKTSIAEYWDGIIPWLSVKDFNNDNRYVYETEKHISKLGLENSSTKLLQRDDIILSARGTVGEMAMIPFPMAFNQSCYGIRGKGEVNQVFLYYLIKNSLNKLRAITHGSVFDTITRETFSNISVALPDMDTQLKIADVLENVDDKIETNQAINKNLEEQARALYQTTINSNVCHNESLSTFCSFQEGYVNPSQKNPEYFDGEVKWLRAVDINESCIIDTSRTLTRAGFESAKKSAILFKPNTIAISKSGTIGRLGIVSDYMCGNRAVINVEPLSEENLAFIYCYLKSRQREFQDMAVGSVQKNLYVSVLEQLVVPVPGNGAMRKFNQIGNSLFDAIRNNCVENQKLIALRDALLPKLMSGELDVSAAGF